jgi:hypothetical protein
MIDLKRSIVVRVAAATLLAAAAPCASAGGNSTTATCVGINGLGAPVQCGAPAAGTMNVGVQAPSVPRYVQIVGVQDIVMNGQVVPGLDRTMPASVNYAGTPGVDTRFCVKDSAFGAVALTITGPQPAGGYPGIFQATSTSGSSDVVKVRVGSALYDGSIQQYTSVKMGENPNQQLSGGQFLETNRACNTGDGGISHVRVSVELIDGIPQDGRSFAFPLTLIATPL